MNGTGFRFEGGRLVKYTSYGRKRRNWKQDYRKRSRKKLRNIKICEKCGAIEDLTVHHKTPLSKKVDISVKNLEKLCKPCHEKLEYDKQMEENLKKIAPVAKRLRHPTDKELSGSYMSLNC